jgi:hypothetical protein
MEDLLERLDEIEDDLASRAFLYDDPMAFREAIDAVMAAVRAAAERAREAAA